MWQFQWDEEKLRLLETRAKERQRQEAGPFLPLIPKAEMQSIAERSQDEERQEQLRARGP